MSPRRRPRAAQPTVSRASARSPRGGKREKHNQPAKPHEATSKVGKVGGAPQSRQPCQRDRAGSLGGYGGTGKTAIICNVIADRTRRGEHVVIWHSGEDSQAKWERRIELMGGVMALVHFVETQAEVWKVLNASDPPALLVIDPLQQFLDSGGKNDEAVRTNMNELTRLAAKNCMGVVAIMHWKEHYRDKLVGSEVVWQIARMIHKVERGDAENNWILRRVRSQDAPLNWFRRFHTYKLDPNDPVLAKFDSTQWEPAAKETEEQEIDRFILETTEGRPYPVRNLRKDVGEHGQ
jgi:AAA domain